MSKFGSKKVKKRKPRKRKKDYLSQFLSPEIRFWVGISLIPGYFMIDQLLLKIPLISLFALCASLGGKRIRPGYFIIMTLSITFFHILSPVGRIIAEVGPIKITLGALYSGLLKGVTLSGLVFLSLFSVSSKLKLPGRLGGLLGRMFFYFERILDGKKRISPKAFIASIDEVLLDIFPLESLEEGQFEGFKSHEYTLSKGGRLFLTSLYILILEGSVWGFFFLETLVLSK